MPGVTFIERNGKRILFIDAANSDLEELMELIEKTKVLIVKEPLNSVLTLTVLKKGTYHGVFRKVAKEFTMFNKPYVRAGAIVGLDAATIKEFQEVMKYSQRQFNFFEDVPHAFEWLLTQ
ncbi:MAG TPA: hypothetical protein VK470_19455 [Bacteroidota bacterium]|nr:hypothetical protein [Bacteroidota bacterium]